MMTPSQMGKKGAKSLYAKLTPAQRKKKARSAAKARWAKVKENK